MIPTIGLIVAVYAIARLVQVPLEMTANKDQFPNVPFVTRFGVIVGVSIFAILALGILSIMLLASGAEVSRAMR